MLTKHFLSDICNFLPHGRIYRRESLCFPRTVDRIFIYLSLIRENRTTQCEEGTKPMDVSKLFELSSVDCELVPLEKYQQILDSAGVTCIELIDFCKDSKCDGAKRLASRIDKSEEFARNLLEEFELFVRQDLHKSPKPEDSFSTGLNSLDFALMGGLPRGQITEIYGPSGAGKSQLLLHLALSIISSSKQNCIFLSTESYLETRRLLQLCQDDESKLDCIHYLYCRDFENQDHAIYTQLEAKLRLESSRNHEIAAVFVDSISHHMRLADIPVDSRAFLQLRLDAQNAHLGGDAALVDCGRDCNIPMKFFKGHTSFKRRMIRKKGLFDLHHQLSRLAQSHNVAMVIANQVSDLVEDPSPISSSNDTSNNPLKLNSQMGFLLYGNGQQRPQNSFLYRIAVSEDLGAKRMKIAEKSSGCDELNCFDCSGKLMPALGYTWAKLVSRRIYLQKVIAPISGEDKHALCQEHSVPRSKCSQSINTFYAKVVSPRQNFSEHLGGDNALFHITSKSLEAVPT